MKFLICPDSFKGTLTAIEAAQAMKEAVDDVIPTARYVLLPVGDGGEGTADAVVASLEGREKITAVECDTVDPLHRPITATYHLIGEGERQTAFIESAAASGLTLVSPEERDIMRADTFGTGLLVADAFGRGVRRFMIGMGGTATCDGGEGAWRAMSGKGVRDIDVTLLCDVDNPLCGPSGAAAVFGPQKGADASQIPLLDGKLRELAARYREISGVDILALSGAGAAGGLAGMFMALYGARAVSGIAKVLELLDFDSCLEDTDLVITGEGRVDATTLSGKAPKGILDAAARRGVPVAVIGGRVSDETLLRATGFSHIVAATPPDADPGEAPARYLKEALKRLLTRII